LLLVSCRRAPLSADLTFNIAQVWRNAGFVCCRYRAGVRN